MSKVFYWGTIHEKNLIPIILIPNSLFSKKLFLPCSSIFVTVLNFFVESLKNFTPTLQKLSKKKSHVFCTLSLFRYSRFWTGLCLSVTSGTRHKWCRHNSRASFQKSCWVFSRATAATTGVVWANFLNEERPHGKKRCGRLSPPRSQAWVGQVEMSGRNA